MESLIKVKSCGVLVFREIPTLEFLLLRHPNRYDLPKGHLEAGETELECALRELREETSISMADLVLLPDFRYQEVYYPRYSRLGGRRVEKTLVVFLGWLTRPVNIEVHEHDSHEWLTWKPPHSIQVKTIDVLLRAVEKYYHPHLPRHP